jgi:hypothetical protein
MTHRVTLRNKPMCSRNFLGKGAAAGFGRVSSAPRQGRRTMGEKSTLHGRQLGLVNGFGIVQCKITACALNTIQTPNLFWPTMFKGWVDHRKCDAPAARNAGISHNGARQVRFECWKATKDSDGHRGRLLTWNKSPLTETWPPTILRTTRKRLMIQRILVGNRRHAGCVRPAFQLRLSCDI